MLLEILIVLLVGLIFGILCGIIPGLHPNTVAVILLSLAPFFLQYFSPLILALFIVVVTISNTFIDSVPAIYLGAPDEGATALSVLPGHRLLLQGRGHEAVLLTVLGSFAGLLLAVALVPLLIPMLNFIYPVLKKYIAYILILVVFLLIVKEKSKLWALIVFFLSGTLGLAVFNLPNLKEPLFPLFSGLFGISGLALSLQTKPKIPIQKITTPIIKRVNAYKAIFISVFSGSLVSLLPGLGNAQAAILGSSIIREGDSKNFLIMVGGINTVNLRFW